MLPRFASVPKDFWSVGLPFNHSHCLSCGSLIFLGGQIDFDADGNQLNPGDLEKQAVRSMENAGAALVSAGAWKGLIQLVTKPHYWEKTMHGISKYRRSNDLIQVQGISMNLTE